MAQIDFQGAECELEVNQADPTQETPAEDVFIPPSIYRPSILAGHSYTHYSPIPPSIRACSSKECILGVDEAGRGPVLGPMVYSLFYLPRDSSNSLLKSPEHRFSDSKTLTASTRSELVAKLCDASSELFQTCGWATRILSARDISAAMLKPISAYNLNEQAMDATINLIQGVFAQGIDVREIYVDTIGSPATYQKKLEKFFPTTKITVAKKADSLFPCVSAASVCAKVTRDAALEVCHEAYQDFSVEGNHVDSAVTAMSWGSGYPSDSRTSTWLKSNMDPIFGWGNECRFSWGTAKELLENHDVPCKVDWPEEDPSIDDSMKLTSFFVSDSDVKDGLANWFGAPVTEEIF